MAQTNDAPYPVLEGIIGWVRGEVYRLAPGATIVGRSRHCDVSLRHCAGYKDQPEAERDLDHDFNTVSRRHISVTMKDNLATVEDLSTNGTYCNEILLTEPRSFDLTQESPLIRLGSRECFRLSLQNPLAPEKAGTTSSTRRPDASNDTCSEARAAIASNGTPLPPADG